MELDLEENNREIKIIDNFYSQILKNTRKIRIYLPPSYHSQSNKYYPVLYIHDGQNVFYGLESFSGESWQLHQTADYLIKENLIEEIIIIAVDHMGEKRLSEYGHQAGFYRGEKVQAAGFNYEKFLIEELMPAVEANLRVKKGAANTALIGSSMGGLVTFNIGLRRPDLFGRLGIMSPSLWWGNSTALEKINSYNYADLKSRIWLDTGSAEKNFNSFSEELIKKFKELKNIKGLDLKVYLDPAGIHSETAWADRVYCPLLYFFGEIGEARNLKLFGPNLIGIKEKDQLLNPVLTYSSGFKMTVLAGDFKSLAPDYLKVNKNGVLSPQKAGKAEVEFKARAFKAVKKIKIKKQL